MTNIEIHDYLQGMEFQKLIDDSDGCIVTLRNELNGLAVPSKFYTYLTTNKQIISIMNKKSDIAKEIERFELGYAIENNDTEALIKIILQLSDFSTVTDYREVYNRYYSKDVQLKKYSKIMKGILNSHLS